MRLTDNPVPERSRQAPMALLFILGTFVRRLVLRAWPLFIVVFLRKSGGGAQFSVLMVVLAITAVSLVVSLINYFRYYFWLDEHTLYVEEGVLRKSRVSVPFDRIQSINSEQNVLFQLFGLVRLEVDTAGSKGSEVKMHAVSKKLAQQIHDYVFENKTAPIPGDDAVVEEKHEEVSNDWRSLLKLSPFALLKVGLAQNHFRAILVLFAFLVARFEDARELLGEEVFDYVDTVSESSFYTDVILISELIAFVLLFSIVASILTVIARYWGFHLYESLRGMKTEAGLFTRRQKNLSYRRAQLIQFSRGPVSRFFGFYQLKVYQAAAEGPRGRDAVQIPGCPDEKLAGIMAKFFSGKEVLKANELEYKIQKVYAFRKWLFIGLLRSAIAAIIIYFLASPEDWWLFAIPGAYASYDFIYQYLWCRKFRFGFTEDTLSINTGFWITKYQSIQLHKVQAVDIIQGIYQRQKGYADLLLFTAGGSVRIPYLTLKEANALQDFILYKVESSAEKWM